MTMNTSTTEAHLATVAGIYEAFGRGDVAAILDRLAEDVSWDADWADNFAQRTVVGHVIPRRGRAGVGEFFALLGGYTVHEFAVLDLLASADRVAAVVVIDAAMPGGGRYRDEEVHMWTFDADGKVSALRHHIDTAKHLAAAQGEDTRPARVP
ncbi:MAG TPA: nuclear transport factor 2 family protein [Rugosimonospora sp.]|nr:nuclear transport factor 2 family protein [Rugosimonospora sp.]